MNARPPFAQALVLAVLLAASALTACVRSRTLAYEFAPPRPDGCPVDFVRASPDAIRAGYRQLGVVCISASSHLTNTDVDDVYAEGRYHDELRSRACAMGGEAVAPVDVCSNGRASGTAFGVYARR